MDSGDGVSLTVPVFEFAHFLVPSFGLSFAVSRSIFENAKACLRPVDFATLRSPLCRLPVLRVWPGFLRSHHMLVVHCNAFFSDLI